VRYALLLASLLLVATGCRSSDPGPGPGPTATGHHMRLDENELKAAGDALAAKLAALPDKETPPRIKVGTLTNSTGHRLDMTKLEDEGRRRLVESNKFSVGSDPSKASDFVLKGEVQEGSIRLDVVDSASGAVLASAIATFVD
jgi:hypothetical protein